MNEITLTINGKKVKGKAGDTVLEVCKANGIDVPTLCHLDGLSDVGACRMCVVEIEKERRPVPSCTYPAREGLVVQTHTEKLERYRRQILELIFTEHNHFCMFCEKSGDCELQQLGYQYQMDNVRYPYAFPSLSVDSLNDYIAIDHNRCILCGRCIRACSEIAAVHTLDFANRGWRTEVAADLDQSLGESSSCINCGSCVQACPTGAIFNKINLYKGTTEDCEHLRTICPGCGVGCELEVLVRDNNLVRIDAPDMNDLRGSLCRIGRFELIEPSGPRITSPYLRDKEGALVECSMDRAVQKISSGLDETKDSFAGMVSSCLPVDTLSVFNKFFTEVIGTDSIDTLDGAIYRKIAQGVKQYSGNGTGLSIECPIQEILESDCILVVGGDPENINPVVAALIRRASQGKAKLVVINSKKDVFPIHTDLWLRPKAGSQNVLLTGLAKTIIEKGLAKSGKVGAELKEALGRCELDDVLTTACVDKASLDKVAEMYASADRGVIVYGEDLLKGSSADAVTSILHLANITGNQINGALRVISLKPGANSRGAWEMGLAKGIKQDVPKGLYLLLSDDMVDKDTLDWLKGVDFLVVQASYQSPVTDMAHVVLPSPIWAERNGKYVDMEGRSLEIEQVLRPRGGLLRDEEILTEISRKMGKEQVLR